MLRCNINDGMSVDGQVDSRLVNESNIRFVSILFGNSDGSIHRPH